MTKKSRKRKLSETKTTVEPEPEPLPAVRHSDEPIPKKVKWVNKQRVLVLASRGISHRDRHLMEDIKKLMPHHKPEAKMERQKTLSVINEMCEMKNCNKTILFEGRHKRDLYMWLSNVPNGPSVKFLVQNIHTMAELKMTGNCLRGSRPLLSFDPGFEEHPHNKLLKELITQIFGVPNGHPKSQPFIDHVYNFTILDNRIWFRNYQILSEDGALVEIGPRFVLNPVKIFSGSFGGVALWENPFYVSPTIYRRQVKLSAKDKYVNRVQKKIQNEMKPDEPTYDLTPLDDIFKATPVEKAKDIIEKEEKIKEAVKNGSGKKKMKVKKFKRKAPNDVIKKTKIDATVKNEPGKKQKKVNKFKRKAPDVVIKKTKDKKKS